MFVVSLPKTLRLFVTSLGKTQTMTTDQHICSRFLQKVHHIVGCKRKFLIAPDVRNTENVASLPPWQLYLKQARPWKVFIQPNTQKK